MCKIIPPFDNTQGKQSQIDYLKLNHSLEDNLQPHGDIMTYNS